MTKDGNRRMPDNALLKKLSDILRQDLTREVKAARIAEAIRDAGGYRWVGIYEVDLERGIVTNIAWSGPSAPGHPSFPTTKGLTSRAIAGKRTINVGDVANDPDYLTALGSTRSEIIIPVLNNTGDRVLGTIDVESECLHAFDSAMEVLLEQCARVLTPFWTER